jgi:hypothetical protein
MTLQVPMSINEYGFTKNSPIGVHTARTMMLAELRLLLAALDTSASLADYRLAIIEENVLHKNTAVTRRDSFLRLRTLYALNDKILLFRALRDLWGDDIQAQAQIALLCTIARDSIIKATAAMILAIPIGETVTPTMIMETVSRSFPDYYNSTTLASIGRNVISSWQQAGLLSGKLYKVRVKSESRPASVAYALLLGYLSGERGEALFHTLWCQLLDTPVHILHAQAFSASQRGWIEYRHTGEITDVSFRFLLRKYGKDNRS